MTMTRREWQEILALDPREPAGRGALRAVLRQVAPDSLAHDYVVSALEMTPLNHGKRPTYADVKGVAAHHLPRALQGVGLSAAELAWLQSLSPDASLSDAERGELMKLRQKATAGAERFLVEGRLGDAAAEPDRQLRRLQAEHDAKRVVPPLGRGGAWSDRPDFPDHTPYPGYAKLADLGIKTLAGLIAEESPDLSESEVGMLARNHVRSAWGAIDKGHADRAAAAKTTLAELSSPAPV